MIVRDQNTIVEHKLYWGACASEHEAAYLSAILNSEAARLRIAAYQSRGQFGARDFDKVMFNLPIPAFDGTEDVHAALADAGTRAEASAKLVELVEGEKFQRARKRVRDSLIETGISAEIDKLVEKLLDGAIPD